MDKAILKIELLQKMYKTVQDFVKWCKIIQFNKNKTRKCQTKIKQQNSQRLVSLD